MSNRFTRNYKMGDRIDSLHVTIKSSRGISSIVVKRLIGNWLLKDISCIIKNIHTNKASVNY